MAHLRDVSGVGDPADVVQWCVGCGGREGGGARFERRHDAQPIGLTERHEAHGDRDLRVDRGGEIAEERGLDVNAVRGGDGADGDRVGAGRWQTGVDS